MNRILKINLVIAIAMTLAYWSASAAAEIGASEIGIELSSSEKAWLKVHPVIRVAPDPDFKPIEYFTENGEFQGIVAGYLSLLEKRLGIRFTIIPTSSWDEAIDMVKRRDADMFSAATYTKQREEYVTFTSPHLEFPGVIIVRENVKGASDVEELHGLRVAVVSGYVWQEFLEEDHPQINLVPVTDVKTGLESVSFGAVDAMVSSIAIASYYIAEHGITHLRVAGKTGYWTRLALATRKDWPQLNSILEKGVASITPADKEALFSRWLYLAPASVFDNKQFWFSVYIGLGIIVLIVVGMLLWNRSLRAAVVERTKKLTQSEERLQLSLDIASDGSRDWNIKTGYVLYSDAWIRSLGYSRKEVPAHISFWEGIVHRDDMPHVTEILKNHLENKTTIFECEYRLRMKSGEFRYDLDRGQVVERDEEGKPIRMIGTKGIATL